MGHSHHFLTRLDRVSRGHLELALTLYNDPELLRLALTKAPERAERVAVSLADPATGPFVVVTRAGGFVTCLGDGMRTDLPVVPRDRLDAAVARRAASQRAERAPDLLERIFTEAQYVSREDFVAMSTMQPLIWDQLFEWALDSARLLARTSMGFYYGDADPKATKSSDFLHSWWHTLWSLRHMLMLLGVDSPRSRLESLPERQLAAIQHSFSAQVVVPGFFPVVAAAAWCTSRFGEAFLPICRHRYRVSQNPAEVCQNAFDLFAIAGRTARHRATVRKVIHSGEAAIAANDGPDAAARDARQITAKLYDVAFAAPETLDVMAATLGATMLTQNGGTDLARRHGWASALDVPADLARVTLVNTPVTILTGGDPMTQAMLSMPAVARMSAEEFYLPQAWVDELRTPWSAEETRRVLRQCAPERERREPVRSAPTPGRNELCSCASGRKYKKCCAVALRPAPKPANDVRPIAAPSLAVTLQRRSA